MGEPVLTAFLRGAAAPFKWGVSDCLTLPANWIAYQGHDDPMGPWRGRYRTYLGAKRIMNAHGGMVGLFEHAARHIPTAEPPAFGCIAVIDAGDRACGGLVGAIDSGAFWVAQGPHGPVWINKSEVEVMSTCRSY